MLKTFLAVLATAWLTEAQDENDLYNNFGAVVFIRTGDRTPLSRTGTPVLTPLGAQQMYELGQNFRGRYISSTGVPLGLDVKNLPDMSLDTLNNDQLYIQTPDQPHLVAAAQAFMQGLYPPSSLNSSRVGPLADGATILGNGSVIDAPLGGYQYPKIESLGNLDPQSIYINGADGCPTSQVQSAMYETTDEFMSTQTAADSVYKSLDLAWFNGDDKNFDLNYRYAWEIYDSLTYAYNHNQDAYDKLNNDSNYEGVYDQVRLLAGTDAYYRYANTSSSTSDNDDRAMAGKTLAARILGQFQNIVVNGGNTTNGQSYPLTLLFGEHEPLVSFFSVAMIDYLTENFKGIPPYASAMILELFTMQRDTSFPTDHDDLFVRFYFHNGTEDFDGSPRGFSMFNNGHSQMDMSWPTFQDMMSRIMVNQLSDWCDACSSGSLFCWGVDDSTVNISLLSSSKSPKISPAVAGAIGAVVTLAVAALAFAVAMLLGGIRFHRVSRRGKNSALGGFKGSAKLASDADLNLPKNGAAPAGAGIVSFGKEGDRKVTHERVGSWELRQKEFGGGDGRDVGDESRRASFEAIEEAMRRPVEPSERV